MKDTFTYSYSAERQKEISDIRSKYLSRGEQEDGLDRLRRLDRSVTRPGLIASLSAAILGVLLFGTGMCCFLLWEQLFAGVFLCLVGAAAVVSAPVLNRRLTEMQRARLAPQILRLSEELMQ
ncbi:MAG: hypothetical protein K6G66_04320 [Oscillospiraceae bacterium]|nr:hypothetical protein [Oscillospiraceae bacterium]